MKPPTRAEVAAFYDEAASRWGNVDAISQERIDITARLFADRLPPASALDVGCGNGSVSRLLVRRGTPVVTGIDLSPGCIARARENVPAGVEFYVADITDVASCACFAHRSPFAAVLFCDSLEHVLDMDAALRNAIGMLAPCGDLALTFPHPELRRRVGLDGQPVDNVVDLPWLYSLLRDHGLTLMLDFGYGDIWPGNYTTYWACLWKRL